jgi:hypothetical protein
MKGNRLLGRFLISSSPFDPSTSLRVTTVIPPTITPVMLSGVEA